MVDWSDFDGIEYSWGEDIPPIDPADLEQPFFLGEVNLLPSGELFAEVYSRGEQADFSLGNVDYSGIDALLGIDRDDDTIETWADHADALPFEFDADDPDIRGPFFDEEDVNNFINETGLYWADIYYDYETDEYFIDVSY